jgi:hypothetical protein
MDEGWSRGEEPEMWLGRARAVVIGGRRDEA